MMVDTALQEEGQHSTTGEGGGEGREGGEQQHLWAWQVRVGNDGRHGTAGRHNAQSGGRGGTGSAGFLARQGSAAGVALMQLRCGKARPNALQG
jgi:hypothetical protein